MIVSKQKANTNKDIAKLAAEIVSKWKKIVQVEQAKAKLNSKPKMEKASSAEAKSSPAPGNETKAFTGDPDKRRWETEKVDIKRTGMPTRDACIGLIYNGLAYKSTESSVEIIIKAMAVEEAALKEYGETPEYRNKLRSLFQNLKGTNRELAPQVLSGEITPSRFVTMTHEELKSSTRREEDEKLQKENMMKAQVPMAEKSISDALRCGKCKEKKVSYSQAQTRSADEPMTTFCECTVCGNRWKVCAKQLCLRNLLLTITVLLSSRQIGTCITKFRFTYNNFRTGYGVMGCFVGGFHLDMTMNTEALIRPLEAFEYPSLALHLLRSWRDWSAAVPLRVILGAASWSCHRWHADH